MNSIDTRKRVNIEDIGLYIKSLQIDYNLGNNARIAMLITKHFNVFCTEEDILKYEELSYYHECFSEEEYDLLNEREQYFKQLGRTNPFY